MSKNKPKKTKQPRNLVKRVKLEQKTNPVSDRVYKARLRKARRRMFLRRFLIVIIVLVVVIGGGAYAGNRYIEKLAGESLLSMYNNAHKIASESKPEDFRYAEKSFVYSKGGTLIAALTGGAEDTIYLKYDEIPTDVINAFVAVEDRTFWENDGYDMKGVVRAMIYYLRSNGAVAQGASTITQQLARTEYLTREKSLQRKVKEIFIARELAQKYSKEQIAEYYVNTCCFANGIYGIEDAAQQYFGLSADELDVSQIAYLCAIPNRPEYYDPFKDPATAIPRRDKILKDMLECGYISQSEYEQAIAEELTIVQKTQDPKTHNYETTYAADCATRYLMKRDGFEFQYHFDETKDYQEYLDKYEEAYAAAKHELYTGGYKVHTSLNLKKQKRLQAILNEKLSFSDSKNSETGIFELQGAVTVVNNKTHKVEAIVGGRSQKQIRNTYSLNRAYQSYRQPGSTFKPLVVYSPALSTENWGPSSNIRNIDVDSAKKKSFSEIQKMGGSTMPIRSAVTRSINGCAYFLFSYVQPKDGLGCVEKMQFAKIVPSDYNMSASLGGLTYGVTTVEMAGAYSAIENHGKFTAPDCILEIIDKEGNDIYEKPKSKRIYTKEGADTMTDIMKGVITGGTASRMGWYGSSKTQAAGKTGTTNNSKDGWFCGFTPKYTAAVWVGYDQPKELSNLYGGTYPASIWKEVMLEMIDGDEPASFELEPKTGSGKIRIASVKKEEKEKIQTHDTGTTSKLEDKTDKGEKIDEFVPEEDIPDKNSSKKKKDSGKKKESGKKQNSGKKKGDSEEIKAEMLGLGT